MFKLFKRFLAWINPFTDTGLLERLQRENQELDAANRHHSDQAIRDIVTIENLKTRVSELQKNTATKTVDNEMLNIQIAELNAINTREKATNDLLNIRITNLEESNAKQTAKLKLEIAELEKNKTSNPTIEATSNSTIETTNNSTMEATTSKLMRENMDLKDVLANKEKALKDLNDALADKEKLFNNLYNNGKTLAPIIDEQLGKILELNKRIQTLENANDVLAHKYYMAEEAIKNTEGILTDWYRIKQTLIKEGIVKENVKTTLSKPIRNYFTANSSLRNESIQANEELKSEINDLRANNEALKAQNRYNQYKINSKLKEEICQFDLKRLKTVVQVNNMTQQVQDNTVIPTTTNNADPVMSDTPSTTIIAETNIS